MGRRWDVAVVGGGAAATAAAIALARAGRSVVVLERSSYDRARIGETLAPVARLPLVQLGAWESFIKDAPVAWPGTRSAWGCAELDDTSFVRSAYGDGWHIDRSRFDAMLAGIAADAGACVRLRARVSECRAGPHGGWEIDVATSRTPETLRAAVLIDAVGRASLPMRARTRRRIAPDRLVGIVATFAAAPARDHRTLVEAVAEGWWYSAAVPNAGLSVAYMTDADLKPAGRGRLGEWWRMQLERAPHTRSRLRRARQRTTLSVVAANTYSTTPMVGSDWLAIGDAAVAYDPLSSLGLCRAMESGLQAARAIAARTAGDPNAFDDYERGVRASWNEYLRMRAMYYRQERRWPDSVFWWRRQAAPSTLGIDLIGRGAHGHGRLDPP